MAKKNSYMGCQLFVRGVPPEGGGYEKKIRANFFPPPPLSDGLPWGGGRLQGVGDCQRGGGVPPVTKDDVGVPKVLSLEGDGRDVLRTGIAKKGVCVWVGGWVYGCVGGCLPPNFFQSISQRLLTYTTHPALSALQQCSTPAPVAVFPPSLHNIKTIYSSSTPTMCVCVEKGGMPY